MNIAEAKNQIEETVEGYLTRDETGAYLIAPEAQRPLFLLGAPGIGKTAVVGQVARELGIGLVSYSMTHHTRKARSACLSSCTSATATRSSTSASTR